MNIFMQSNMISNQHNFKIFRRIVLWIKVNMMYYFSSHKFSTKYFFSNKTMFVNIKPRTEPYCFVFICTANSPFPVPVFIAKTFSFFGKANVSSMPLCEFHPFSGVREFFSNLWTRHGVIFGSKIGSYFTKPCFKNGIPLLPSGITLMRTKPSFVKQIFGNIDFFIANKAINYFSFSFSHE